MKSTGEYHDLAMESADRAMAARRQGADEQAKAWFREALDYERHAAEIVAPDPTLEPTRSVLHRSAAALAIECGELREAERLIARALAGNPPDEIADELRELWQTVYRDLRGAAVATAG
jgi:hypothetical protein